MSFHFQICEQARPAFAILKEVNGEYLKLICLLIRKYITNIENDISYKSLMTTIHLREEDLRQCIFAVGYVYSECLKNNVNPFDFANVIKDAQLSENSIAILLQAYDQIRTSIRHTSPMNSVSSDALFKRLDWRLDLEISNRNQYRVYKPSFVFQLDSLQDGREHTEFFECEYSVLQSIQEKLKNSIQSDWECNCHMFSNLIDFS